MRRNLAHDRTEARNGTGPKIVAVAEPTGQNHHVRALQVAVLVPEVHGFLAERLHDGLVRVVVAVGAGKGDDAELHTVLTVAISKSSVTGLASRRSHISRVERSAA